MDISMDATNLMYRISHPVMKKRIHLNEEMDIMHYLEEEDIYYEIEGMKWINSNLIFICFSSILYLILSILYLFNFLILFDFLFYFHFILIHHLLYFEVTSSLI